MSANRYLEQLRREATRNPKKAAILGVMLLVAGYFWAPLVAGWFGSSGPAPAAPPPGAKAPVAVAMTAPAAATATVASGGRPSWQELVEWMKHDRRMRPAEPLGEGRDPFCGIQAEPPAETKLAEQQVAESKSPTLQESGVKLTTTLVGTRGAFARINGKTYPQGAVIEVAVEGAKQSYRLLEVHDRHVVLERDGARFELALPIGARANDAELVKKN